MYQKLAFRSIKFKPSPWFTLFNYEKDKIAWQIMGDGLYGYVDRCVLLNFNKKENFFIVLLSKTIDFFSGIMF